MIVQHPSLLSAPQDDTAEGGRDVAETHNNEHCVSTKRGDGVGRRRFGEGVESMFGGAGKELAQEAKRLGLGKRMEGA